MHFDKTEDIISFIRSEITPEEVTFFKNKPFIQQLDVQAKIMRKYAHAINIYDSDLLRDIYQYFEGLGYITTMDFSFDENEVLEADPELAIAAIFRVLYQEWNGENYKEKL